MAKVDGSLGSLVQGVSQQPPRARLPGQSEEQINVTNDEVFGLSRRSGTTLLNAGTRMPADTTGHSATESGTIHMQGELYQYTLRTGVEPVLRMSKGAVDYPVHIPTNVAAYMTTPPAAGTGKHIVFKEMDYTVYVLNTTKKTARGTAMPVGTVRNKVVLSCRGGKYSEGYRVDITVGAVTHTLVHCVANGASTDDVEKARVATIMRHIWRVLTGGAGTAFPAPDATDWWTPEEDKTYISYGLTTFMAQHFDIRLANDHIVFTPKVADLDYTVLATNTSSDDLFIATYRTIERAAYLPRRAPLGMVVRVKGSARPEDDYFLQWKVEGKSTVGTTYRRDGVWEECTAPDQSAELDATTMPHELLWDASNNRYTIKAIDWTARRAGNDDSNPMPKFLGETINDITDFQGRAVFLHSGDITMSRTDKYTDVFKQTATTKLATDPINMRSTATEGDSTLKYAVPFRRDLILFGTNNTQFRVSGGNTLTTDNASMVLTSEFDADLNTRPQPLGSSVLFTSYTGRYTQLHEMYLSGTQNNHERRTLSTHVPRYVIGQATVLAADDGSTMAAIVGDDPKTVYVYEYLWVDDRRVQSAWSKWVFQDNVHDIALRGGTAYITCKSHTGAFYVDSMPLYREDVPELGIPVHLDTKQVIPLANTDTITAYCADPTKVQVVSLAGSTAGSRVIPAKVVTAPVSDAPNRVIITLKAAYTGKLLIGTEAPLTFVPTMPTIRDRDGVAVTGAELTITDFRITFERTGPFTATRVSTYEQPADYWTQVYSGRTLGDPDFRLGAIPVDSDTIDFPFSDASTTSKLQITANSHLPLTLTEIEWTGNVRNRSRRITNGG